jgi:hypothetical protein
MIKKNDGLFGFSVGCLPQNRWDEVNEFFNETGYYLCILFSKYVHVYANMFASVYLNFSTNINIFFEIV